LRRNPSQVKPTVNNRSVARLRCFHHLGARPWQDESVAIFPRALGMIERLKVKVLYGAYRRQP
jgi:hypothetical protein